MDTIELTFTTEDGMRERKGRIVRSQVTHWYMSFDEQDHTIVCFGAEHVRVSEPMETVTALLITTTKTFGDHLSEAYNNYLGDITDPRD